MKGAMSYVISNKHFCSDSVVLSPRHPWAYNWRGCSGFIRLLWWKKEEVKRLR